jgi:16S rRNA (adenine1518-N6/adenine1519-N6)-dimethyltransferase
MAQSKREIQQILEAARARPRHRFGQNFMIDQNLVRLVAEAGEIKAGEIVIEVGPGTGTLTEELLARGGDVVAVEIDAQLAVMLREQFSEQANFKLIEGDALAGKHELNAELLAALDAAREQKRVVKLVANLPYNIASPLIVELLIAGVELLAVTVQKEVGDRLRAKEDSDDYGALTVMVQLLGDVEVMRVLPAQAFWPMPKIASALVRVRRRDRLGNKARDFSKFLQTLFSFRRKTLRRALAHGDLNADQMLTGAQIDGNVRVETLVPEKLLELFDSHGA